MESRESGERLRRFVKEHMARQNIDTMMELARRSDVGRDTLQAWFRGRRPTPQAGGKVAAALGVTYYEMLKAFEGTTDEFDPETMVAAFEWAIEMVRAGQVPQNVEAAVRRAHARSGQRRPTRPPTERSTGRQTES
jgi:transcriptional regulator with XRE-family HTH domain